MFYSQVDQLMQSLMSLECTVIWAFIAKMFLYSASFCWDGGQSTLSPMDIATEP